MTRDKRLSYSETLQHLYPRTNSGIKLGLQNTQKLLDALGNPEKEVPFVVVAGTNGKGSTSSLLAHALNTAGYKTGLYTSPHLLRFTERIQIGGIEISQKAVCNHYQSILQAQSACDYSPTFFECVTAMTLLEFKDQQIDIGVLEVGLGGRLDSTNVVPKLLSIITPIGLDHQQFLGNTLTQIATEKAGIIAPRGNVLLAKQKSEAQKVLQRVINEKAATPHPLLPSSDKKPNTFRLQNIELVRSALSALGPLGFPSSSSHFKEALRTWQWPGRFQLLAGTPPVLLDGAHNPHALEALFDSIEATSQVSGAPLHVVFSSLRSKSTIKMVDVITNHCASLHLCPTSVDRSLSLHELHELNLNKATVAHTASDALARASELAANNGIVLVTGSLFLVADILHQVTGESRDPAIAS